MRAAGHRQVADKVRQRVDCESVREMNDEMSGNGVTRMTLVSEANEGIRSGVGANEEVSDAWIYRTRELPDRRRPERKNDARLAKQPEGQARRMQGWLVKTKMRLALDAHGWRRYCRGRRRETDFPAQTSIFLSVLNNVFINIGY